MRIQGAEYYCMIQWHMYTFSQGFSALGSERNMSDAACYFIRPIETQDGNDAQRRHKTKCWLLQGPRASVLNLARNQYAHLTRTAALASLRASPYEPQHAHPCRCSRSPANLALVARHSMPPAASTISASQEGLRMLNLVDNPAHVMKKKTSKL